jgi:hypothetical protein
MAVRLAPRADEPIRTKPVRMPDWAAVGEDEEHIEILDYLRPEVFRAAQEAARRTTTERGISRDTYDPEVLMRALFDVQVKGWRLFDQDGSALPFTPENLARLPWDVKAWLNEEILACGGNIPTRNVRITVGAKEYDFRRPDAGMGGGPAAQVPDPQ